MIEVLLGSKDKENVLQYILAKEKGYASEIANFYGTKPSQMIKQLEALEIGGVLVSFQVGKARVYQYNPRYFFLNELKSLLLKVRETYKPDLIEKLMKAKVAPRRKNKPAFERSTNEINS
ncbi:MAG: winged helix-turn-helix domain-containing protein [Sulfuricurvum sp.]|nr:winged helix-turn-helix domain-containing protein [Sulfuricurvum sp.]MDD5387658.1 winged helix-turn-helix domain-containing protein [Sulfuricurvum sp.]